MSPEFVTGTIIGAVTDLWVAVLLALGYAND